MSTAGRAARLGAVLVRTALSLVAGLLASMAIWRATADGPILTPDSFSYVGAARSLADHGTLRIPTAAWRSADSTSALHQFPPAYPVALAAAMRVAPPLDAARLVAAGAALLTVAGLTSLVADVAGLAAGAAVPLLLLALRGVAVAHLAALSEPPFLVALTATVACMTLLPRRPWSYGLAAALADLVRYAGASLVGASVVWATWHTWHTWHSPRGSAGRRLARTVGAGLLAGLPGIIGHVAWMRRARRAGFAPIGAAPRWYGHAGATFAEGGQTLAAHLAPGVAARWQPLVATLVAAGVSAAIVRGWRVAGPPARRLLAACALVAGAYAAVIVYARLFVGDEIEFDDRILTPLLVCAAVAVAVAAGVAWRARAAGARRRWTRAAVAVAIVGWLVGGTMQTWGEAADNLTERGDYASPIWGRTSIAAWLQSDGRHHALFTNDPVAIYFMVDRPARALPQTAVPDSVARFAATFRAADGALVAYAADVGFGPSVDVTRLAMLLGLCAAVRAPEGTVWVAGAACRTVR